jgi:hypothetical protein
MAALPVRRRLPGVRPARWGLLVALWPLSVRVCARRLRGGAPGWHFRVGAPPGGSWGCGAVRPSLPPRRRIGAAGGCVAPISGCLPFEVFCIRVIPSARMTPRTSLLPRRWSWLFLPPATGCDEASWRSARERLDAGWRPHPEAMKEKESRRRERLAGRRGVAALPVRRRLPGVRPARWGLLVALWPLSVRVLPRRGC